MNRLINHLRATIEIEIECFFTTPLFSLSLIVENKFCLSDDAAWGGAVFSDVSSLHANNNNNNTYSEIPRLVRRSPFSKRYGTPRISIHGRRSDASERVKTARRYFVVVFSATRRHRVRGTVVLQHSIIVGDKTRANWHRFSAAIWPPSGLLFFFFYITS